MRQLTVYEVVHVFAGTAPKEGGDKDKKDSGGLLNRAGERLGEAIQSIGASITMAAEIIGNVLGGDSDRSFNHRTGVSCPGSKDMVDGNCVTPQSGNSN